MEGFGVEEILGLRRCGACHGIFPASLFLSFFLYFVVVVGSVELGERSLFWGCFGVTDKVHMLTFDFRY